MKLVIFCHPPFLPSQSMPRFAQMLKVSFSALGYQVEMSAPRPFFHKLFAGGRYAKWAGYIDQYLVFPFKVRKYLAAASPDTMFVFADQALGPWIPLLKDRPHVVHVHDLLNLRSALGEGTGHVTSFSGRVYQRYIRRGFRKARHFISVSKKTKEDLHKYGEVEAITSEVVYNGFNFPYQPMTESDAFKALRDAGLPATPRQMLLHVGGGQWYKNQPGLIALYSRYASDVPEPLPLWCIGPKPNAAASRLLATVPSGGEVLFFQNLDNLTLQAAYSYARAFLFPSLAEGFGWPLIEAQACGCPVITTDEPPMSEVAGAAAIYIPRLKSAADLGSWAAEGARALERLLELDPGERNKLQQLGCDWVKRFDGANAIAKYLEIYIRIFDAELSRSHVATTWKRSSP
jgi:glycosyltransferase involved in cell wall biosynthesis